MIGYMEALYVYIGNMRGKSSEAIAQRSAMEDRFVSGITAYRDISETGIARLDQLHSLLIRSCLHIHSIASPRLTRRVLDRAPELRVRPGIAVIAIDGHVVASCISKSTG